MNSSVKNAKEIFEKYHRFDDGLIISFEYFYEKNCPLSAKIVLFAKDHSSNKDIWRKVFITIKDVQELCAKIKGNQFNSISNSVKLMDFDGLWCIDIDGTYDLAEDPSSLEEVRKYGECYVLGKEIEVFEAD